MSRLRESGPDHLGDLVAGLVDGQLCHSSRERALSHLARCDECRADVAAQRRLRARMLALCEAPAVPAGLSDRLLAEVRAQRQQDDDVPLSRSRRTGPRAVAGVVLVAGMGVVLVVAGGSGSGRDRPTPRPSGEPTSDILDVNLLQVVGSQRPSPDAVLTGASAGPSVAAP